MLHSTVTSLARSLKLLVMRNFRRTLTRYSTLTSLVLELNSLSLTRDISRSRILVFKDDIWRGRRESGERGEEGGGKRERKEEGGEEGCVSHLDSSLRQVTISVMKSSAVAGYDDDA